MASRLVSVGSYALIGPDDATVTLNTLPITVDSTPTFDVVLGAPNPVVPEAPLTVLLPLVALGLAALAVQRRRRA